MCGIGLWFYLQFKYFKFMRLKNGFTLKRFTNQGFTLIEVMVAVGLTTAISGILMAQYRNYNRQQATKGAAERLEQVYNEAKTNALSGKKDCYVCGGADQTCNEVGDAGLDGWRVSVNSGGVTNGYKIEGICSYSSANVQVFMTRTEQFPSNVTISTHFSSPSTVTFKPLNGGTDLARNIYMQVAGSSGGPEQFMVTAAGEIVPWAPTPIPAATCSSSGGKCVAVGQICFPWATLPWPCGPGEKCVSAAAWCGSYTCWSPGNYICLPFTCSIISTYPYPYAGGTCPPLWVCCRK
jgi:Tfp pilus assembly major pilin PilA